MSYDWRYTLRHREGTREFFQEIDERFFHSSPFYEGKPPFARLIPFDQIKGKRVLEIGCGLGSHAQLMAEAGCHVTAIDLTPKAVELTQKRLSLMGLAADVKQMDAEEMEFEDEEFDFVWSWGVIHHSANPESILNEVYRVLKPSGEVRLMVYHRRSLSAFVNVSRGILSGKALKGMSLADILSYYSDGYVARFYSRSEISRMLLSSGLSQVRSYVLGQTSELIPLPAKGPTAPLKSALLSKFPNFLAERILLSVGGFLFAVALKPRF